MGSRNDRRTTYESGGQVGVAGPGGCFIGKVEVDSPAVGRLWELLQADPDAESIEAEVRASGTIDFAALLQQSGGLTVLLGGAATVRIEAGGEAQEISCPTLARTTTHVLGAMPSRVTLRAAAADGRPSAVLPLAAGVVPAAALMVAWEEAAAGPETPSPFPEAAPPAVSEAAGDPAPGPVPVPVPVPEPGVAPAQMADPEPATGATTIVEPEPDAPTMVEPEPDAATLVEPEPEPEPEPQVVSWLSEDTIFPDQFTAVPPEEPVSPPAPPVSQFDHLFGHTINRSVEEAAIRAASGEDNADTEAGQAGADPEGSAPPSPRSGPQGAPIEPPPPWREPPPAAPPVTPPRMAPDTGMIDSVPWASGGSSSRAEEPDPAPAVPDADFELTIQRSAHQSLLRRLESAGQLEPVGPTVHAVQCAQNHLNPPHQITCRVCGGAIVEQAPVTVPRPSLGVLRLSTGDDIVLDRSVLMGRSPSPDRLVDGERPHVVKLPSPGQDISRNHVEVRIDGWHVLVVDLKSTNGTVVERPGQPPERLRPNDPAMIEPGTLVSIADEISFVFVPT